jgi:colicin import membrane protein
MKKIILTIILCLPMVIHAQSVLTPEERLAKAQKELEEAKKEVEKAKLKAKNTNEKSTKSKETDNDWSIPTLKKIEKFTKENEEVKVDPKYLDNAIPLNDEGKVEFVLNIDANNKNADEIYNLALNYLSNLTQGENQIEGSRVALVNKKEKIIAATIKEWLEFNRTVLLLDRAKINYLLVATCTDNHLNVKISRINYTYEEDRPSGFSAPAEEVITDKYALNKKHTDLTRIFGKFRKATINRKDEIFKDFKDLIQK